MICKLKILFREDEAKFTFSCCSFSAGARAHGTHSLTQRSIGYARSTHADSRSTYTLPYTKGSISIPHSTTQHNAASRSTPQHHAASRSITQHHAAPRSTPQTLFFLLCFNTATIDKQWKSLDLKMTCLKRRRRRMKQKGMTKSMLLDSRNLWYYSPLPPLSLLFLHLSLPNPCLLLYLLIPRTHPS